MHLKKFELQPSKKSNLFFHYTDKLNSYIKLHVSTSKREDGFICGNKLLFSDFYLKVHNKNYHRKNASSVKLYPDSFAYYFDDLKITVYGYLPCGKGNVYFHVENPEGHQITFHFVRKNFVIQQRTFSEADNYFVFEKPEDNQLTPLQIKEEIAATEDYYAQVAKHFVFNTGNPEVDKALFWAQLSGYRLCTGTEKEKGIWAGLPWFKENWGRDTFIALQGLLLTNGFFADAREVLYCFVKHQKKDKQSINYGRIPNRYISDDEVVYNTADGNLWFMKALWQYLQYTGDTPFLKEVWENIKLAVFSDLDLRTDENGFLVNQDSDTWMDARIGGKQPLSARGNRANEIQALWFESLNIFIKMSAYMDSTERLSDIENTIKKLKTNFKAYFWNEKGKVLADRILENNHPDYKVRPNQLFCISDSHELLDEDIERQITKDCFEKLSLPYGVTSLSPQDVDFHPYHIGSHKYHKDAAYHNGAIWLWLSGPMISSLCKFNWQNEAWKISKNHCKQIFENGCIGTLSENANAALNKGKLTSSGTWSQAWSVAEFSRNFYQDYLGFKPRLTEGKISFAPKMPSEWKEGNTEVFIGKNLVKISWSKLSAQTRDFTFNMEGSDSKELIIECNGKEYPLKCGTQVTLTAKIVSETQIIYFAKLNDLKTYACLRKKNYLFNKIKKEYKGITVREVINND